MQYLELDSSGEAPGFRRRSVGELFGPKDVYFHPASGTAPMGRVLAFHVFPSYVGIRMYTPSAVGPDDGWVFEDLRPEPESPDYEAMESDAD